MRIASLLPSATEIVCALGLGDELVGVSHECDWPPEATTKPVLTRSTHDLAGARSGDIHRLVANAIHGGSSLYDLDEDALAAADPDLILTQELCSVCAVSYREVNAVARAIDAEIQVVSLEPTSIEGILNTITTVGALTETEDEAVEAVEALRERLAAIEHVVSGRRAAGRQPTRVASIEWLEPPFAVGHWVPEQVRRAGGWDVLGHEGSPSVETTWQAVVDVDPQLVVLMPCGFHLPETVAAWQEHERPAGWADLSAVRSGNVVAVDGSSYFSRPGPRVIDGIELLAEILDPDAFAGTAPAGSWARVA